MAADVPASYEAGRRALESELAGRTAPEAGRLTAVLGEARYRQEVIDAITRPYEAKPWHAYRALFLTPARIDGGVAFRRDHAETLERAAERFGVPASVITAIIGVETSYGRQLGRHRVLDALATLGFSYPPRADFFRQELVAFLELTAREGLDPGAVGSYAGAMGLPQFIPRSLAAYAVDFDADGRRDLWGTADAIGSVGNYLARHDWRPGEAVAVSLVAPLPASIPVAEKGPVPPGVTVAELAAAGVPVPADWPGEVKLTLLRLDGEGGQPEHWLTRDNFYAITRYNRSNLYAMAVHQLSQEIEQRYAAHTGSGPGQIKVQTP